MMTFLLLLASVSVVSTVLVLLVLLLGFRHLTGNSRTHSAMDKPVDDFDLARIHQAAADWATKRGQPEAAPIMADKLELLYRLGRRREGS